MPEEWASDGGPQFIAHEFETFLRNWGIHHRRSSVEYPQSNGRAEVGVKTAKRIIRNNINNDGSLNNDKIIAALLQYKNTPLPGMNLSPAQILFHRERKDTIPSHRSNYKLHEDWVVAAMERETIFAKRNAAIATRYNEHTKLLPELAVGTHVLIQGRNGKWKKQGIIIEVLQHRQYKVKVLGSGRVTYRNRRFIKPCAAIIPQRLTPLPPQTNPQKRADTPTIQIELNTDMIPSYAPATQDRHVAPTNAHVPNTPGTGPRKAGDIPQPKIPRALKNLLPYNNDGPRW